MLKYNVTDCERKMAENKGNVYFYENLPCFIIDLVCCELCLMSKFKPKI